MVSSQRGKALRFRSTSLKEYLEFLRVQQGVSEATITIRRLFVLPFLESIGRTAAPSRLAGLSAKRIHDYVIARSATLRRPSRKHLVSSLRSFLRFAHVRGHLPRDLVNAVPVLATRRLDRVPRGISWEAVQQLLRAPDRSTHAGRRDYAVLLLLATYGVRIGQITRLKRQDIHWNEGVICFTPSKGGKPLTLPLEKPVAHALLDYLRKDRGALPFDEVFLTTRAPRHPLGPGNHLWTSLHTYYCRAGIESSIEGSHAIRHAFATRLLARGTPIKTIADLLGHQSIDTTFMYTKVDLPQLRTLAREWPEVRS